MLDYFIYAHIRPDKNEVFYIGRGKCYKRCSPTYRAYDTRKRNIVWQRIVNFNSGKFNVEIIEWCKSLSRALEREKFHIKKIGRKENGKGTLINLTDGGDGSFGLKHSLSTRKKLSEMWKNNENRKAFLRSDRFKKMRAEKVKSLPHPMLGKKASSETRAKLSEIRRGEKIINAKKVIDTINGIVYGCVEDAARAIGIGKWSLYKSLSGARANPTAMRYI